MKLIITGVGGLLGPPLARLARQQGHEVVGVVRRPDPGLAGLVDDLVVADLATETTTRRDWRRHAGATILHLAGETRIHGSHDFDRLNLATTVAACGIARQTGGRLVFLSSAAVYSGPVTRYPVRHLHESDPTQPDTAYGRSKKSAEEEIRREVPDVVILRLFSLLSCRLAEVSDRGHLVQAILRALATGEPVVLRTDPSGRPPVRDYVGDTDVARAILAAAALPATETARVFNLCTGVATDARQMIGFAAEAAGREIPVRLESGSWLGNPVMVGDTGLRRAVFGTGVRSAVREFWQEVMAPAGARKAAAAPPLLPKG